MKKVIIMRGIPGSGKSTMAQQLAGDTGKIHSTDDYFMKDGKYEFDTNKLRRNHQLNFQAFKRDLALGISPVIVDNTNSQKWEYENYTKAAEDAGYEVEVVQVPHIDPKHAAQRNTHGVPEESIRRMIARWEP